MTVKNFSFKNGGMVDKANPVVKGKPHAKRKKKKAGKTSAYAVLKTPPVQVPGRHPGGRPPVQLEDLPDNWQELVLEMGSKGFSDVEIRANLCFTGVGKTRKFSIKLWYRLIEREKEFGETLKVARELCEAWWIKAGREGMHRKNFNTGPWVVNMRNRFKWDAKTSDDNSPTVNYITAIIGSFNTQAGAGLTAADKARIGLSRSILQTNLSQG